MKKTALLLLAALISLASFANDPVKDIMKKYKGEKGFISINISNGLLKLLSVLDDDKDLQMLSNNFDGIKVLVNQRNPQSTNFLEELKSAINAGGYEEMVHVNETDEIVKILVKHNSERIEELLILVDSDDEDVIVQLSGSFTMNDLASMGGVNVHGMNYLNNVK